MCGNQNRRETCLITGIVDGKFDAITGLIFEAERKQALYLLTVPVGRVAVFRLMLDIGADYSLYFSLRDCDRGWYEVAKRVFRARPCRNPYNNAQSSGTDLGKTAAATIEIVENHVRSHSDTLRVRGSYLLSLSARQTGRL
jgi:hypothetical protein